MKSSDLSRAQLVSVIAHLRGSIYSIRGIALHDPKSTAEILSDTQEAIAVSTFDVSLDDLVEGSFADLPSELMEAVLAVKPKPLVVEDDDGC